LLDDPLRDGLIVAVWAFIGGGIYAAAVFWLGGALLHGASQALGGQGSYRRARHVVGFACAPLALSLLVVWPVGHRAFGGDLFRSGGVGRGRGDAAHLGAIAFGRVGARAALLGIRACTVDVGRARSRRSDCRRRRGRRTRRSSYAIPRPLELLQLVRDRVGVLFRRGTCAADVANT
jgi:hypothetical protein